MELMEIKIEHLKDSRNEQKDDFWSVFAKGYLEIEKSERQERLREFSKSYDKMKDKTSFNAQYLKILIENLEDEL